MVMMVVLHGSDNECGMVMMVVVAVLVVMSVVW